MKRFLAVLLILAMIFSTTACKPDNITYPVEIIDPAEDEPNTPADQPSEEEEPAEGEENTDKEEPVEREENPDEEEPATDETDEQADIPAEQPATQEEDKDADAEGNPEAGEEAEEVANPQPQSAPINPLAVEDFAPSTATAGTLQPSGIIKPNGTVSSLKNRTVTLYTADDVSAFSYHNEKGKLVDEWQWMEALAEESGFLLKRSVKNSRISVKAQRVALYAGQKLSLVQMTADQLGEGMTLAASAAEFLNADAQTFGVSKAVLKQSDYKLFAPIGNVDSLWYNPVLLPAESDPLTLSTKKQWTVEQFKTACASAPENTAALQIESVLPWATLSGRSPLTLLEGKLDSNINAGVTRSVWTALRTLELKNLQTSTPAEGETPALPFFRFATTPEMAEGETLTYAPLPAMQAETAGSVIYSGTFFALPKYETDKDSVHAALTFAELWCNRYTETRAATLKTFGISGAAYQQYCDMAENQGYLILRSPEIEETVAPYLAGVSDPAIDMATIYNDIKDKLLALIAARNLYY